MRLVTVVWLVAALLAPSRAGGARAQLSEPFVSAGVWYPGGMSHGTPGAPPPTGASRSDRDRWRRDLAAIKTAGFNSIRTVVDWAGAEPEHGQYRFDRFDELLTAADEAGLKVIVQVDAGAAPVWLRRRYQDSIVEPEPGTRVSAPSNGYCVDHPGVRADLGAFIGAAAAQAAAHRAFYAIDVWRDPGVSSNSAVPFCYCPYTQARFRDALQRKYRSVEALNAAWSRSFPRWRDIQAPRDSGRRTTAVLDWKQFFAVKLQEDLKFRADASALRGARPVTSHSEGVSRSGVDDWLMTAVVDHYGTSIPWMEMSGSSEPARLMASLDAMRSAARDKLWWVGALYAGGPGAASSNMSNMLNMSNMSNMATAADLRLWAWAALSRGAGATSYDDWRGLNGGASADALVPDRVRAAGDVAGVVGRNSSLFGPLRPHASRMAIIYQPDVPARPESAMSPLDVYRVLFDQNIQVDFIHPDEVVAGFSTRYDLVYASAVAASSKPVAEALKAFVRDGGTLVAETSGTSRPLANDRGAAQTLTDMFATGAKPLRSTAPDASVTTSAILPGGRRGESDVMVATYGSGRAFLISLRLAAAGGRNADGRRRVHDLLQRVFAAAGAKPEVRIDGTGGLVEARVLESADAMLLVAMNYGSTPRKVTFRFGPDVPEAIWQNMESGAAVNFVQGADGPTYTRTFAGRDVMVLVRGKRLR